MYGYETLFCSELQLSQAFLSLDFDTNRLLKDYKQFIETERRRRRRRRRRRHAILLLNTVLFRDKKSTTLNQQNAQTCFLDTLLMYLSWFCVVNCLSTIHGMKNRNSDTKLLLVHRNFIQKRFYYSKYL
jgi:hypothetical protein